ncbi:DUF4198 domain-containing protein [Citreimonas salinaria]|uniref:Uncharacterized conserved protein, contains GH25 family domain n=1 Tax=Citreimonas salinaria TaxID=321339 RepID=A0A1H3H4I0_9RHOB|nr:DUF4198 domain-containing protein [Citreimonas salinaria]SDY10422.1 Uncharacterized conserved protein, contains GH25 family domain [Citreimonas salinaria]
MPRLAALAPTLGLALAACLVALPLRAHEFWIEPEAWQVAPDEVIAARLINGQEFDGIELSAATATPVRAEAIRDDSAVALDPRGTDKPAIAFRPAGPGLTTLLYQTDHMVVIYDTLADFASFAESKGADWAVGRHREAGLREETIFEAYARFAKALVAVGDGAGADALRGMEIELVAETNPYTDPTDGGVDVRLFYRGAPLADTLVTVFDRAPDGTVETRETLTDAKGRASVAVTPGHDYLVDAVVIREPAEAIAQAHRAVWESVWASLTFSVPE